MRTLQHLMLTRRLEGGVLRLGRVDLLPRELTLVFHVFESVGQLGRPLVCLIRLPRARHPVGILAHRVLVHLESDREERRQLRVVGVAA